MSIVVLDPKRVERLVCLQVLGAPEENQPHGVRSWKHLADMVLGKTVDVEWAHLNKFDEIVGKVTVDGRDVGLEQIKSGLAWHYKQFQDWQSPRDRSLYSAAEAEARNQRVGIWRKATNTRR